MKNHHFRAFLYFSLFIPIAIGIRPSSAQAQTWQPVGGYGTDWPDSVTQSYFHSHGLDFVRSSYPVNALCVYNNKLYAGGDFVKMGRLNVNHIASWDGKKWDTLAKGTNGRVRALVIYHNMLCVGGCFSKVGKKIINSVGFWVDTANTVRNWYPAGDGFRKENITTYSPGTGITESHMQSDVVYNLTVYRDTLYAFGDLYSGGISKWKQGRGWRAISYKAKMIIDGEEKMYSSGPPAVIQPYKNKLYMGEYLWLVEIQSANVQVWNDTIRKTINDDGRITCQEFMTAIDSLLYAGRWDRDGTFGFEAWNGEKWSMPYNTKANGPIWSMLKYKNKLYIGGEFDTINGKPIHGVAVWSGNDWEQVGEGLSYTDKIHPVVTSLCEYKGDLYAAGLFYHSGKTPLQNIARLGFGATKSLPHKRKVKK